MKDYYHCLTGRYKRRAAAVIAVTASLSCETACIAFFVLFFNIFGTPSQTIITEMLTVICVSLFCGLLICFIAAAAGKRKIDGCSRYTYLDIQLKAVVISRYASFYTVGGKRKVWRDLYYIPLKDLRNATPSRNGRKMVIDGDIRCYSMESRSLGYHVRNGDIEFDRWWLNVGGFEKKTSVTLPAMFGPPAKICKVLRDAKKRFDAIPPPKKHVFKEAQFIRRRPKRRLLPEDLDYKRRWDGS